MEVNPDLFALPGLEANVSEDGKQTIMQFNLGRAFPITVYVCPSCGRVKLMSAIFLGNVPGFAPPEKAQSFT